MVTVHETPGHHTTELLVADTMFGPLTPVSAGPRCFQRPKVTCMGYVMPDPDEEHGHSCFRQQQPAGRITLWNTISALDARRLCGSHMRALQNRIQPYLDRVTDAALASDCAAMELTVNFYSSRHDNTGVCPLRVSSSGCLLR